jgi:hypothetical protein
MESARKADEVGKAWERRIVVLQEENAELVVQNQGLLYQNIQLQLEQQTVRGNLTAPALREVPTLDRGDRETEERERLVAVILKQRAELQRLHCRICLYGRLVTRLRGRSQDVEAIIEQQRQLIDGYRADIGDLKGLLRDKEREVVDDLRIDGGGWAIAVILGLMVIAGWVSSLADTK